MGTAATSYPPVGTGFTMTLRSGRASGKTEIIAIVTESAELDEAATDVWEAISFLRSKHLGAGSVLQDAVLQRLREALPGIEENGWRIEVPNLGAALGCAGGFNSAGLYRRAAESS